MPSYPILTFEQANPFLTGIEKGDQLFSNYLKNKQEKLRTDYLPDQLKEGLDKEKLANAMSRIDLQYKPQMTEAELAYKQAQTPYLNAQTKEAIARVPLLGAQTDLTRQQSKFLPLEKLIESQRAMDANSRFGAAYQLSNALKGMSAPARETWISQHQNEYNNMLTDLGNRDNQMILTSQILKQFFPNLNAGQNAPMQQPNIMQTPKRFSYSSPEQINQVQLANQLAANKGLTSAATQRQMEGAIQVENIINDPLIQSQVVNAAQYAGAANKGKFAVDALSQNNPKAYEDYVTLKNQTMPLLLNRIKTLDQMGATDKQREDLENLWKKTMDSLTSNKSQFIEQFNALGKNLDVIAQSVQTSATPLAKTNRLGGFKEIQNNYSQEDLEYTAKKHGMTVDQLKQRLGAR